MDSASLLLELLLFVVFQPLAILNPLNILEIISKDARNRRHTKTINFLCSYNKTSGLKRPTVKYSQAWSLRKPQFNASPPTCIMSLLPFVHNSIQSHSPLQVAHAEITELSDLCMQPFLLSVGRDTATEMTVTREKHLYTQKTAPFRVMGEVPGLDKRQKGGRESQIFVVVSMGKKRRGRAPVLQA